MTLERTMEFRPAYDYIGTDKEKYGIHCVHGYMTVKGDKGVINFQFGTGLYLPKTTNRWKIEGTSPSTLEILTRPMGFDVGYHSLAPLYDYNNEPSQQSCMFLDGKPCYWDGSALRADTYMQTLLEHGTEKVWELLEEEYKYTYEERKD